MQKLISILILIVLISCDSSNDNFTVTDGTAQILDAYVIDGPISVESVNKPLINIYPNPASSTLNIQNVADISTIELVNLLGQVTYKQLNSGNSSVVMSVEDQASGVYMIRLTGKANEISYKKLIIE